MSGPCMCGDICCGSCGPAQGNFKCEMCGKWSSDGGCDNPEKCNEDCRKMYEGMASDFQWEKDNADEIDRAIRGLD